MCTNRRVAGIMSNHSIIGSNFKLTPALSYDPATVPSKVHSCAGHGTATEPSRRTRTGSCAADGGSPVSFGTTCALLRAWAPPRVSGSDEHDAQPQKIYTTRQILHPLPELHGGGVGGGWLGSSATAILGLVERMNFMMGISSAQIRSGKPC